MADTNVANDDDHDEFLRALNEEKETQVVASAAVISAVQNDLKRARDDDDDVQIVHYTHQLHACRSIETFDKLNTISEGVFGRVFRARNKETKEIRAVKMVKMKWLKDTSFPKEILREINIHVNLEHANIVKVDEVLAGESDEMVFMVMEYMATDLKYLIHDLHTQYTHAQIKNMFVQLLQGAHYLHDNWILHRDLKTSNILVSGDGMLKLCDFGKARYYSASFKDMTTGSIIMTPYYRSPEVVFEMSDYGPCIDMWSLGCIWAELLLGRVLFKCSGKNEEELNADLVDKMIDLIGFPPPHLSLYHTHRKAESLLHHSPGNSSKSNRLKEVFGDLIGGSGVDLMSRLLCWSPGDRWGTREVLTHPYFAEEPLPCLMSELPPVPDTNSGEREQRKAPTKAPSVATAAATERAPSNAQDQSTPQPMGSGSK